jgi:hypothetical protein
MRKLIKAIRIISPAAIISALSAFVFLFATSVPATAGPSVQLSGLRPQGTDIVIFVDCAERIAELCRDREESCNATGRETRAECRRKRRICVASQRCLQGPQTPSLGSSNPSHEGTLKPPCIMWAHRGTGRTPCDPATQNCICARRDRPPVEVRPPSP